MRPDWAKTATITVASNAVSTPGRSRARKNARVRPLTFRSEAPLQVVLGSAINHRSFVACEIETFFSTGPSPTTDRQYVQVQRPIGPASFPLPGRDVPLSCVQMHIDRARFACLAFRLRLARRLGFPAESDFRTANA